MKTLALSLLGILAACGLTWGEGEKAALTEEQVYQQKLRAYEAEVSRICKSPSAKLAPFPKKPERQLYVTKFVPQIVVAPLVIPKSPPVFTAPIVPRVTHPPDDKRVVVDAASAAIYNAIMAQQRADKLQNRADLMRQARAAQQEEYYSRQADADRMQADVERRRMQNDMNQLRWQVEEQRQQMQRAQREVDMRRAYGGR